MKLKIIHTSDVHGYMYKTDYVSKKDIGLLSLSEKFNKDSNTIIIEGGDFIQGSPFSYYIATQKKKYAHIYSDILNEIGYDVATLGNHEFNFGQDYLKSCYQDFKGELITANIDGIDFIKPYTIIEKEGYKIGVIGFVTQNVSFFEQEDNIKGLEFNDIIESYSKYEQELKDKCDYIIVNYHGGAELDIDDLHTPTETLIGENLAVTLFNKFKSIDLILTGHQHRIFTRNHDNRVITQAGHQAQGFVEVEVMLPSKEVVNHQYVYNDVETSKLYSLTDKINDEVEDFLDRSLNTIDKDILITDHFAARIYGHPLINFIHDVQLKYSGADISAISIFHSSIGFYKDITMRQVIANYPFPNTLTVLNVHRDDILKAVEVSASYFEIEDNTLIESDLFVKPKRQDYQYDMFKGFTYKLDISKEVGKRVVNHNLEDKMYTICLNNYRASNFSWYPMYEGKEIVKKIEDNMIDLIVDYLVNNDNITIDESVNYKIKY